MSEEERKRFTFVGEEKFLYHQGGGGTIEVAAFEAGPLGCPILCIAIFSDAASQERGAPEQLRAYVDNPDCSRFSVEIARLLSRQVVRMSARTRESPVMEGEEEVPW